jgi:hypothetical protein
MDKKSFFSSGHLPTLVSAFLYFDISFMVWVLFGPMNPFIADQMHLTATQKGLLRYRLAISPLWLCSLAAFCVRSVDGFQISWVVTACFLACSLSLPSVWW